MDFAIFGLTFRPFENSVNPCLTKLSLGRKLGANVIKIPAWQIPTLTLGTLGTLK